MRSIAILSISEGLQAELSTLGGNIRTARQRRRQTQKAFAERVGVDRDTVGRLERGDPTVSMGVYAQALFALGLHSALGDLASPDHDAHGKLLEAARRPIRVRAPKASRHDF